jgi:hypothetical protein
LRLSMRARGVDMKLVVPAVFEERFLEGLAP